MDKNPPISQADFVRIMADSPADQWAARGACLKAVVEWFLRGLGAGKAYTRNGLTAEIAGLYGALTETCIERVERTLTNLAKHDAEVAVYVRPGPQKVWKFGPNRGKTYQTWEWSAPNVSDDTPAQNCQPLDNPSPPATVCPCCKRPL